MFYIYLLLKSMSTAITTIITIAPAITPIITPGIVGAPVAVAFSTASPGDGDGLDGLGDDVVFSGVDVVGEVVVGGNVVFVGVDACVWVSDVYVSVGGVVAGLVVSI